MVLEASKAVRSPRRAASSTVTRPPVSPTEVIEVKDSQEEEQDEEELHNPRPVLEDE